MRVETLDCNELANRIRRLKCFGWFEDLSLQHLHNAFQSGLEKLAVFFEQIASICQDTENALATNGSFTSFVQTGLNIEQSLEGNANRILKGGSIGGSVEVTYALAGCSSAVDHSNLHLYGDARFLEMGLSAGASLSLMKKNRFDPELNISAEANAHLAATTAKAEFGNSLVQVKTQFDGEVGTVQGKAKAVLSLDEQTLSAQVGAAAVRGKCTFAFELLGIKITVEGSAAALAAEAGLEFSHKNREWEVGAKLSFIAGAGLKVRVEY